MPSPVPAKRDLEENQWPKISIVTPSYNQGQYIEETIRAVLLQGYPDIEYLIMDGGSEDGTVEIIQKYEPWLAYWVSEPDQGQTDAINRGFARVKGAILAYINSDDFYEPRAFFKIAEVFLENPTAQFVAGGCAIMERSEITRVFKPWWPAEPCYFLKPFSSTVPQPACFWGHDLFKKVGGFETNLHYCFDQEFYLKIALAGVSPFLLEDDLARYRDHDQTKTRDRIQFFRETLSIINKNGVHCGMSSEDTKDLINQVEKEIAYENVIKTWIAAGRLAASSLFLKMIITHPDLVFRRKILGLARRLLFFPRHKVPELGS